MAGRTLWILLAAYVLSLLVRAPLLDRPLSAHHEFCTALVLTILHNWQGDGFAQLDGGPAITFTGPADRYPPGWSDLPGERDGILFYFSHPPLAYDLPHLLFSALGMPPSALPLQLFNLFFHLLTTLALFLAVRDTQGGVDRERAGLYAAVLYLFMPAPLWFHANAYMSDLFVQNFWVLHLAMTVRLFSDRRSARSSALLWAGITLFLTVYTSWPGIFAAMAMALVAAGLWRRQPGSNWWWAIVVASASAMAALGLTVWRYLHVVDAPTLVTYYASRFAVQGTPGASGNVIDDVRELMINYRIGFLPLLLLLVWILVDRWRTPRAIRPWSIPVVVLIVLSGLPVMLDHTVFLHYARHDFAVLKAGPLLCALAGISLASWPTRRAWLAVTITALMGMAYFLRLNPWPGHDDGRYAQERDLGLAIASASRPTQAVFFRGLTPEPQVSWYAKRTIVRIDSLPQAHDFLSRQGTREGVVFELVDGRLQHQVVTAP